MVIEQMITILSIIVPVLFILAYTPQLITTYKTKNATGVSKLFWFLVSLSTLYSLLNVLKTGNAEWYTYFGQFINAGIAFLLVIWINKIKSDLANSLIITVLYSTIALCLYFLVNLEVSQTIATIAILLAYVDQIGHFIRSKDSTGTNPLLFVIFAIGLVLLITIMLFTGVSLHIIGTECTNVILLIICAFLSKKYLKKSKK
ncbi:PQ-loop domain-containing transporter [Staphylococcus saprophyticus]|uniref:PQ-loop domain-containing transporter n=1 Tax=Staphylococcus saprophyticus TaxID=29385 RepID=UPI0024C259E4|nr:PQ-loop domain-containing transporter [Staphylococcus saprophyticus]MDK1672796.1 PQ-loop domain-containing transporter [Staphylococcus saprophyticus]